MGEGIRVVAPPMRVLDTPASPHAGMAARSFEMQRELLARDDGFLNRVTARDATKLLDASHVLTRHAVEAGMTQEQALELGRALLTLGDSIPATGGFVE